MEVLNGRTIRLAVAIVPSVSRTPAPDPAVYLSGGPMDFRKPADLDADDEAQFFTLRRRCSA